MSLTCITGGPSTYDPDLYNKQREKLLKILPTDQSQLPPRRMIDSFDAAIIPIASDPSLRVILPLVVTSHLTPHT